MTTKEIAREIDLTEGALYRHFDHKAEIFFALMAIHLPTFYEAFQVHQAGSATVNENLVALALATIQYYEQIVPLGASFMADTELLVQLRASIQPLGVGPQSIFEDVTTYIEKEQQLGRMRQQIPALTLAILLLGPCFQWVFNRRFLGADPFHKTEQQFAEELVQGLLAGAIPD
ncbi:TetR/AcrR family transcriptional regulator [Ktedonosporobacter rubrisoli]|uniref:TetR/AcrR family transcriptional regulator n=1 Tax=Ktedonosporobacter rubrisoli TaxID=2509675 RepID=A0A4P6K1T7_KTERU|nr:TetR/AcrR family transcriptional regulator [Ktedonosporobacter rubrisoli]QBD81945.1 TetR/AcrR family transcriptional regulator [Ktedonosporobacter rubrisoli]